MVGCGREPAFADRSARVTVDGETTTYHVDACGLDGETVFLVARADDGSVVQAVIGVERDGTTGVPDSTGITVTAADRSMAAFGPESWTRRGGDGEAPGSITGALVRGARIQARGEAQPVDADDRPIAGSPVAISFDARCDERDTG